MLVSETPLLLFPISRARLCSSRPRYGLRTRGPVSHRFAMRDARRAGIERTRGLGSSRPLALPCSPSRFDVWRAGPLRGLCRPVHVSLHHFFSALARSSWNARHDKGGWRVFAEEPERILLALTARLSHRAPNLPARVAKWVYAFDLKSNFRKELPVRVRSRAPGCDGLMIPPNPVDGCLMISRGRESSSAGQVGCWVGSWLWLNRLARNC